MNFWCGFMFGALTVISITLVALFWYGAIELKNGESD